MARSPRHVSRVHKIKYHPRRAARSAEEQPDGLPVGFVKVFVFDDGVHRLKPTTVRDLKNVAALETESAAALTVGTKAVKYVKSDAKHPPARIGELPVGLGPTGDTTADTEHYPSVFQGFESFQAGAPDDESSSKHSAQHASAAARIRLLADQKAGRETADWIVKLASH